MQVILNGEGIPVYNTFIHYTLSMKSLMDFQLNYTPRYLEREVANFMKSIGTYCVTRIKPTCTV